MRKKDKNEINLLQQLLENKDLLQKAVNGEITADEIHNSMNEDVWSSEYLITEILKKYKIKYFRERFYIYNGKYWELDNDKEHLRIKKLITNQFKESDVTFHTKIQNNCIEYLKTQVEGFNKEQTRYEKYLFPNGTLTYKEGSYTFTESFNPDDEIRNDENPMFPYEFDENNNNICELEKVFAEWVDDPKQLIEIIKYSLFMKGNRYNRCFYLKGAGQNGKSQFLQLTEDIVPKGCVTKFNPVKISGDKDGSEDLEKSYVNTVPEIKLVEYDTTIFKNILGDDGLQINPKYKQPYIIKPACKFILSSNDYIVLKTTFKGDIRRFLQIPFENEFKMDVEFYEKRVKPHISTLFVYCLQNSKNLWESKLYLSKKYLADTRESILSNSDTVFNFIEEFEIKYSKEPITDRGYIYRCYKLYVRGQNKYPLNDQKFWNKMDEYIPGCRKNGERKRTFKKYLQYNELELLNYLTEEHDYKKNDKWIPNENI